MRRGGRDRYLPVAVVGVAGKCEAFFAFRFRVPLESFGFFACGTIIADIRPQAAGFGLAVARLLGEKYLG